jgi:hypothetical protein
MKWGGRFNECVVLTAPIFGAWKTAEFAACHGDVTAIRDLPGAERIAA